MGLMVILDAGHGVDTPGKRSPDGRLREGRWARAMAARLAGALAGPGRECPLVVPGDADMPLPERAARVNELAARAERAGLRAVLVSLHCDAAGMGDSWRGAQGWSVYVAPGAPRPSARLAGLLVEAMRGEGVKVRARGAREPWWEAKFYMLAALGGVERAAGPGVRAGVRGAGGRLGWAGRRRLRRGCACGSGAWTAGRRRCGAASGSCWAGRRRGGW